MPYFCSSTFHRQRCPGATAVAWVQTRFDDCSLSALEHRKSVPEGHDRNEAAILGSLVLVLEKGNPPLTAPSHLSGQGHRSKVSRMLSFGRCDAMQNLDPWSAGWVRRATTAVCRVKVISGRFCLVRAYTHGNFIVLSHMAP